MAMTVGALAQLVAGTLHGDPDRPIKEAAPLDAAGPDSITFLADPKKATDLERCRAGAVLLSAAVSPTQFPEHLTVVVVKDPLGALCVIAESLRPMPAPPQPCVHPSAVVDPTAVIGEGVHIGPFAIVEANVEIGPQAAVHAHAVVREGCKIGRQTQIHSHAVLYPRTEVGDRCIVFAGAILGRDGFGFRLTDGAHKRIPQLGGLRLGNDVEIGANTTIDCATFGWTTIDDGTKIDNQVMIGHNCSIGKHNIIIGHVGVSGSSTTGDYVVLAGKVGIADHVRIGSQVMIGAGTGVHADLPGPAKYMSGVPCMPELQAKRVGICLMELPELRKKVKAIERRLDSVADDSESVRRAG